MPTLARPNAPASTRLLPTRFASALSAILALASVSASGSDSPIPSDDYAVLDAHPHNYWTRPLNDPFTKLKEDLDAGRVTIDQSNDIAFLHDLLAKLDIPVSSQLLVFSTTSLQLRFISPRNPRAIYFNEDVYVGFIPGGRIEVVSIDPEAGGIFYIFDIPRDRSPPVVERSNRCMNCHADSDTGDVPGIVLKSVVPGRTGGSLDAFRRNETGHAIPLEQRFGGWHLTGNHNIPKHWGNLIGRFSDGELLTQTLEPGSQFNWSNYPVATSDILPHLLLEHQTGFVNRAIEAHYRARTYLHEGNGRLSPEHAKEMDRQARLLTRYLLFADETRLPKAGIEGDPAYIEQFLASRRPDSEDQSLKDLDLNDRLFKYRCSYMIYSAAFQGLPDGFRHQVYRRLQEALDTDSPDPDYRYLPNAEKKAIAKILRETLPDFP
ncbi:MAG: hypothetical protein AAF591_15750 [Verrucomicrobiota bacterium]